MNNIETQIIKRFAEIVNIKLYEVAFYPDQFWTVAENERPRIITQMPNTLTLNDRVLRKNFIKQNTLGITQIRAQHRAEYLQVLQELKIVEVIWGENWTSYVPKGKKYTIINIGGDEQLFTKDEIEWFEA